MEIDPETAEKGLLHRSLTSIVAPRPIGWISSKSSDGRENLAPYSYFNGVSTDPPVVVFGPVDTDDGLKDTPSNVVETGEFVCNLATRKHIEQVDRSSEAVPPDVDEFDYADLDRVPATTVDVSRVADAPAALECVLYEAVDLPTSTAVFGEVVHIHVDDAVCTDGRIDMRKLDNVGRLGGPFFTSIDVLDFERGDG